jgi:hypothetical protein
VARVQVQDGPQGATTAIEIRRENDGGKWALALVGLRSPETFFERGHTYRMQVWARDLLASNQSVGIVLANSNFAHRPTEASRYARYSDTSWHLLQRTFVVTAPAAPDTSLHIALPVTGPMRWQFTMASVREVVVPQPAQLRREADRVIDFTGAVGGPPDPGTWNHDVGGHGWGDNELQTYTQSTANAWLDGRGGLLLTARQEDWTGPDGITRHFTSSRLNTKGKVEVSPGSYVEAEITAPTGRGVRPAFWLLGANFDHVGWPACGELDVMEATQRSPAMVRQTIHVSRLSRPKQDAPYGENAPGGYTTLPQPRDSGPHRYGVYFDDKLVQFYVDRRPTLRFSAQEALERDRAWPFDRPQILVLNIAVAGVPDAAKFPVSMKVGAISVWANGVPF